MKKFKKIIVLTCLLMALFSAPLAQNSHALIGVVFQSKPVKVVGAIGAVAGSLIGLNGYVTMATAASWSIWLAGASASGYGIFLAGFGLVILDDHRVADVEFKSLDLSRPELYQGFSREQVEIYNSELAQLNAVRQTIISETNDREDTADAEELWKKYSPLLNPATVEIAQAKAAQFISTLY